MQRYDVFLVAAPKDYNKIRFVIMSIFKNLTGFKNIYLCTPSPIDQKTTESLITYPIHFRLDMQVLKAKPQLWKYRPNWICQQFIKLFQNETECDYYFVIDCDTIINKPMPMFTKAGQPIWNISWEQNNLPYYQFNRRFFGYGRIYNHSFLSDTGFYSKKMINEMLSKYHYTVKSFIDRTYMEISPICYPSEADIYMSYVYKYHKDTYHIRSIKNKCDAREGLDPMVYLWPESYICEQMNFMAGTDYDTFAIHSWVDRSHDKWSQ